MTPQAELGVLALLAIAAMVAFLARRYDFPYAIGLVLTGLAIGHLTSLDVPHLSKELLFLVILPGLIFEAAFQLQTKDVKPVRWTIALLAGPGVLLATALTGTLLWLGFEWLGLGGLPLLAAMLFAALICATDPVSVLSVLRSLGVDRKLAVLMEGESLFNDGTAVVVFTILLALVGGATVTALSGTVDFLRITVGAAIIGAGVGLVVSLATRAVDDPLIEITLTVLAGYGAFVLAEMFHLSGVIACVVAGMIVGNWGAHVGMSAPTRLAVESFWTYLAFILNSVIFLLVGYEIRLESLIGYLPAIMLAWTAVLAARGIVIYGNNLVTRLVGRETSPWSWSAILTWGGLRGGLSMVLALAIPRDFPQRDLILHLTFGTVLLSLVLQGLTIKPLLASLGLSHAADPAQSDFELALGQLRAAEAALAETERLAADHMISTQAAARTGTALRERITQLRQTLDGLRGAHPHLELREQGARDRHLLLIEKDSLVETQRLGLISKPSFERLTRQIDEQLFALRREH
ncbi:MAG: sodium:proton antiporter [Steroidobacteraceae bacterium]